MMTVPANGCAGARPESGHRAQVARTLLRAARVPQVVIGTYWISEGEIRDAEVASVAPEPSRGRDAAGEVVQVLSATLGRFGGAGGPGEIRIALESGDPEALTWIASERCLLGLWSGRAEATPFVALIRKPSSTDFSRAHREVARMALLYETDRQRWCASAALPMQCDGGITEVIGQVTFAVALVDAGRSLLYTNHAADRWLNTQQELCVAAGRLSARSRDVHKRLTLAVRSAAAGEPRIPGVLIVPGPSDCGPPQVVTCAPLGSEPGQALVIFGERLRNSEIENLLLNALGLTCAERRLAACLLAGATLETAARETNIKLSTARSYLKQIFAKTGVRRQSELVAIVGGMVPPVRGLPAIAAAAK
jgi:DNA-binding CsgD family transcriptional regulator